MKKYVMVLPALLGFYGAGYALESGASFLRIDTDARAVSMGSAYTALATGVSAISYNMAGLARTDGVALGFSHTNWIMDSKHDFIGFALPLNSGRETVGSDLRNGWATGLGLIRLSNSSIEARNADRSMGGSFTSYDQAVSVGFAKSVGRSSLGFGLKYLESSIAGEKARGVGVDLGFGRALKTRLPMNVALAVQNLGTGMKYLTQRDPLPLPFAVGLSFGVVPGISLALDTKRFVYDKQTTISFGTEYAVFSGLALRGGYSANTTVNSAKNKGFSAGVGLNLWSSSLDYSVTPYGELGNTQKLTLKKSFR